MKDDEIESVGPALSSLFREERANGRAPSGTRERVFERLEASLVGSGGGGRNGGSGGEGGGLPAARRIGPWPFAGVFAAGGVIGGLTVAIVMPPRVTYVDRIASVSVAPSAPAPAPSGATIAFATERPASSSTPSAVTSNQPPQDGTLAAERAILDVARTALGRGDGARALEAVDRHGREFPRGQMAEEREAIGVQALVKLGRKEEATARGARFRKRFPNSVLTPVIDAAVPDPADPRSDEESRER